MGILSKLFGKEDEKDDHQKTMDIELAVKIIQDYGSILEYESPQPGSVADSSKLPYSKEQIKQAIVLGLHANDDENMKTMLKYGFVELANWQEGVGNNDQGLDTSKIDLNGDPARALEQFMEQKKEQDRWSPLVEAERESLEQELRNLGLW